MHPLYPPIKPYKCYHLPVGKPHVLYIEETGNPEGFPVIILHSGPGAGGDTDSRRFFDPQIYRIIYFDQRGCGQSTPFIEIHHNTTQLLIEDIESIREFLGLNKVSLFGGGWGALLALLYAQEYPHFVCSLLLYRIFLGRKQDIAWLYHKGVNLFYPENWQEFIQYAPGDQQHTITHFYEQCLRDDNELARMAAAKQWSLWATRSGVLQSYPNEEHHESFSALTVATLASHYVNNRYFIKENQVITNAHKIKHIPTYIVHSRFDIAYSFAGAWELHQLLTSSNLSIVRDQGHCEQEASLIDAVIIASNEMAKQSLDAC